MSRRLLAIAGAVLILACSARAQAPSPDAMTEARKLVITMKLADQYRALLPHLLLGLRRVLSQDRPEIERDYDAMTAMGSDIYAPFVNSMIDQMATVYASNFTINELRQIEAFYAQPVGQKLLEKSDMFAQQSAQIAQDVSRRAGDELKQRLTDALRQKGHKL
ncbi:DUF2059 domain-containing protein [Bradyrhizobium japonicum]|uniref:DUF2059 domain-containing protein n=1 Tax=Bradyrhizobium japonicum TaxID=375 RepID=UPI001BAA2176|nr:DUF2059 domain-containing protein [Bradyrhizobium japonicum]MBR0956594.1 DUF2059 domain-containing protein [Bradyrhizobium japonicum]